MGYRPPVTTTPAIHSRAPLAGTRQSSARALLLVLLGEFVWPSLDPVWSSTLLKALADLDVEPNAARKALQRTSETGLIEAERDGRRVRWTITPGGFRTLQAGDQRVFRWDARDTSWDGRWLMLSVSVPEKQRKLRHHLQSRLTWAGLGSPVPGEWLTPHWERAEDVADVVRSLNLVDQAHMFIGTPGPLTDERRLVERAWDLDELAAEYQHFIDTFGSVNPPTDRDCLRERVALTQSWRRFPYLDPDLPKQFLPTNWPGHEASRVFRDRHNALEVRSLRHWNKLASSA
jgi:phenylacetic acid degradation operon negative regulatory protein